MKTLIKAKASLGPELTCAQKPRGALLQRISYLASSSTWRTDLKASYLILGIQIKCLINKFATAHFGGLHWSLLRLVYHEMFLPWFLLQEFLKVLLSVRAPPGFVVKHPGTLFFRPFSLLFCLTILIFKRNPVADFWYWDRLWKFWMWCMLSIFWGLFGGFSGHTLFRGLMGVHASRWDYRAALCLHSSSSWCSGC